MEFNTKNTESCYWLLDEWNMVTQRKRSWETEPEIGNRGDALINNSLCEIAYDFNKAIRIGVRDCIDFGSTEDLFIYRHPLKYRRDTSRDQLTLLISGLYISGQFTLLGSVIRWTRWRISDKFTQTVDFWLWQKAIYHQSKSLAFLHNLIMIPVMTFNYLFNRLVFAIAGFTDKTQANYKPTPKSSLRGLKRLIADQHFHFPAYALDKFIWQLYTIPNNPIKGILRKVTLWSVEKTNYVERMLLGESVSESDIFKYKPMTGYRWSARLNETSEQTDFLDDKYTDNLIDVAMLHKVYKMTNNGKNI